MNEAKLYEALGRKQAQIEAQDQAYTDLIQLFARVVSGEIPIARVAVDPVNRTWVLSAPEKPAE